MDRGGRVAERRTPVVAEYSASAFENRKRIYPTTVPPPPPVLPSPGTVPPDCSVSSVSRGRSLTSGATQTDRLAARGAVEGMGEALRIIVVREEKGWRVRRWGVHEAV